MSDSQRKTAATYAERAAEVAQSLKPGTYDAVQALALVSIAASLADIAASLADRDAE
jgi:hypothetical protein